MAYPNDIFRQAKTASIFSVRLRSILFLYLSENPEHSLGFPLFFLDPVAVRTSYAFMATIQTQQLSDLDSFGPETSRFSSIQLLSSHDIGHIGTSTGITNSIRKSELIHDQTDIKSELSLSPHYLSSAKPTTISSYATNNKNNKENLMHREDTAGFSLSESQFYARTSLTPITKRKDFIYKPTEDMFASAPCEETFHDAVEDFQIRQDQSIDEKSKRLTRFLSV